MLVFGLLSRRLRPWVAIGGFLLHLGIMFVLLFAAIPPQKVHAFVDELG